MNQFCGIRALLYPLFFLYPFLDLQFGYGNINIPIADILAMVLAIEFFFIVMSESLLHSHIPVINLRGAWIFALFLLVALVSITNSPSAGVSFKYFFRHPFFYFVIYFVCIGSILIRQGHGRIKAMYRLICVSSLALAFLSLILSFQRLVSSDIISISHVPSLFLNHKVLAIILVQNLPFLIFMSGNLKKDWRVIYYLTIVLSVAAIILSFSKASWLMLILIVCVYSLKYIKRLGILKPLLVIATIIIILSTGYLLFEYMSSNNAVARGETSRYFLASVAMKMFISHPVIGNGIGTFMIILEEYRESLIMANFPTLANFDSHGLVFKLLSETGFAGFALYSLFFLYILRNLYRVYARMKEKGDVARTNLLCGCMLSLAVIYIMNFFFGTDTYSPRLWFPLAFIAANGYLLSKEESPNKEVSQ